MTHHLKIWPGSYDAVACGDKCHEIRTTADRNFTKGDTVVFQEWKPEVDASGPTGQGEFTGRVLMRKISYVTVPGSWGLPDNLCVFSLK